MGTMLRAQERLRQSLVPKYHQLFTQISRLEGGVKFLVDLRADIVVSRPSTRSEPEPNPEIAFSACTFPF